MPSRSASPAPSSSGSAGSLDSNDALLLSSGSRDAIALRSMDSTSAPQRAASYDAEGEQEAHTASLDGKGNGGKRKASDADVLVDRARPSRDGLTAADLFDPSKTAAENKSILLSYELDRMGMGRYQWGIWTLCGLGFFIDLLFAQAYGLISVPLKNEPNFGARADNIGTLATAFNVGLTVGAFSWGILVDVVGRKWSFYFTCLLSSIFGIAAGGSQNFDTLRVLTAFAGLGVGGNIPIDATICLEFLPTNRRWLLALLSLFQPVGVLVACGLAYAFIPPYSCGGGSAEGVVCLMRDNRGWRYLLFACGGITLLIFLARFVVFTFHESPAYLVNLGHDARALGVVQRIAKTNRQPPPIFDLADFEEIDRKCAANGHVVQARETSGRTLTKMQALKKMGGERLKQLGNVRVLFANKTMARVTIILWITFICDFFGFNLAGFYLPQILADQGVRDGRSLSETYRDYVAIYAPGIAACLLGACLIEIPRVGRQWSMVVSSALMAVSMFLYTIVTTQAGSVGLNALEYFMQSLFNCILYAFLPEVYPSSVRGTASGLTSTLGRISGIVAPLIAGPLYSAGGMTSAENAKHVLYLGGSITLVCPIALALLPYDTRGRRAF